ncbi:hypothetical protein K438DRAFT_1909836 [Mycena galopus ATCC 62051]|nr:hypothetical protein K438DRAFT_1909836 [Mycena galopus ATCC 62051]
MVGCMKSDMKKAQISRAHHDEWMAIALDRYHEEKARILAPKERRKGVRQICEMVEQHVICYAIEVASRGFLLTHARLKDCVDSICRARMGDEFPAASVGINWTQRFCEKYSDHLQTYWSAALENKRGRAVNPFTNKAYFDLLEEVLAGERDYEFDQALGDSSGPPEGFLAVPIKPENIYGSDESGFFPAGNVCQHVIGPKGKQTQHQQSDGGRENTTVMVTICADDNNIAVEFLKDFNEQTKEKAGGDTRELSVDSHISHYGFEFLRLAQLFRIQVVSYPSHGIHVYQGLYVVIFSAANIKAAFRVTDLWPFNRDTITPAMMAPSLETALRGHLPLTPSTPV